MSPTPRLLRSFHGSRRGVALRYVLGAWLCSWTLAASAQDSEEAALPSERYLAMVSAGVPLRLTQDEDFGQDTFAPVFTDALFGYVFAGSGTFRHGAALGLSLNLTRDGGYSEPVYSAEQFSLMPAYLLYADFGYDVLAMAHLGIPIALTGVSSVGGEIGATLGYRVLARFGLFAQLSFDAFFGTGRSLNPTLALEGGVFFDYEVLP